MLDVKQLVSLSFGVHIHIESIVTAQTGQCAGCGVTLFANDVIIRLNSDKHLAQFWLLDKR